MYGNYKIFLKPYDSDYECLREESSTGANAPSGVSSALMMVSPFKVSLALYILSFRMARSILEKSMDSSTPFLQMATDPKIAHRSATMIPIPYDKNRRWGAYSYAVDVYVQVVVVFLRVLDMFAVEIWPERMLNVVF